MEMLTMMKLLEVDPGQEPQFNIGDRVWTIVYKAIREDSVSSILFQLCEGSDSHPVLVCTGFRLTRLNLESSDHIFPLNEVYATEAIAKELAQWHPVADLLEAEWKQALGDRDYDESLDECELSRCCGKISDIRDLLVKCQENSGLIERDVRTLRQLLNNHEYPMPNGERPVNLDKVITQLGLIDETRK